MRAIILTAVLTVIFGGFQIAGAQETAREIEVRVNEQKSIDGEALTVKFISVLEDSRCPEGADCFWAGNAKISLKLQLKDGDCKTFELNTNLEKNEIEFGGYVLKISELTPVPKENGEIDRNDYVATLGVSKT